MYYILQTAFKDDVNMISGNRGINSGKHVDGVLDIMEIGGDGSVMT